MTATIVLQNHSFLSLVFSFIGVISIIMTALYAAFARTSVDRTIGLIFCLVITFYIRTHKKIFVSEKRVCICHPNLR